MYIYILQIEKHVRASDNFLREIQVLQPRFLQMRDTKIWLVVSTPLKNMSSSVGMMKFPIYGK